MSSLLSDYSLYIKAIVTSPGTMKSIRQFYIHDTQFPYYFAHYLCKLSQRKPLLPGLRSVMSTSQMRASSSSTRCWDRVDSCLISMICWTPSLHFLHYCRILQLSLLTTLLQLGHSDILSNQGLHKLLDHICIYKLLRYVHYLHHSILKDCRFLLLLYDIISLFLRGFALLLLHIFPLIDTNGSLEDILRLIFYCNRF